jgi:TetR/AcrR family transcriptional regulator, cholesterol catabolism regulator
LRVERCFGEKTHERAPGRLSAMTQDVTTGADEPASDTYLRLLDVAAQLFRTRGYGGTTTRELASQLGIQNASLYHYVRGKDDLLYALSVDSLSRLTSAVNEAIAALDDPFERLRVAMGVHLSTALADQNKHATMLSELRSLPAERRAEIVGLRDAYEDLLGGLIAAAQTTGNVRDDLSARHLTLAMLNLLNWSIFWFRPDGELTPDELGGILWTILFQGIASQGTAVR